MDVYQQVDKNHFTIRMSGRMTFGDHTIMKSLTVDAVEKKIYEY